MAQSLVVKVLRLTEGARIPAFAHANDLGADLYASESFVLEGQGIGMVPTGIALEMPSELGAIVEDRSGLATRGFVTLGGVVDPDYRGEIRVIVANLGKEPFAVQYGDCGLLGESTWYSKRCTSFLKRYVARRDLEALVDGFAKGHEVTASASRALEHRRYPLAGIVAQTFCPVHETAMGHRLTVIEHSGFCNNLPGTKFASHPAFY